MAQAIRSFIFNFDLWAGPILLAFVAGAILGSYR